MKAILVNSVIRISSGIILIVLPALLILVFVLHFKHPADFFEFKRNYVPKSAAETVESLINQTPKPSIWHNPHMIAYLSMPLLIAMSLILGESLWRFQPGFALIGSVLMCVGTIFLAGLFATWSTLYDIRNLRPGQLLLICWTITRER